MKDKAPFALAGIWRELADLKTGELQHRYLVVTCPPNELDPAPPNQDEGPAAPELPF
jgi:hypothetical protein